MLRVLGLGLALSLTACASSSPPPPRAAALPSYAVLAVNGGASTLPTATGGSVALIDLWATWCTACERERPKLARLDAAYRAQGLRVIGLNVGEEPSVVSAYLAQNPVPYAVYLDPDFRIADALGDNRLPTLLLVDQSGRIVRRSPSLDEPTLAELKALLANAAPR